VKKGIKGNYYIEYDGKAMALKMILGKPPET